MSKKQTSSEKTDKNYAQEDELLALFEISKAVNSTLDLDGVLEIIIRETLKILTAQAGSIMLLNPDGFLTIKAASGLSSDIISNTRIRPGEGIAGWVFQSGETLLLDGKVKDRKFTKLVERKEEILSSLAVPLRSRGKKIGVLMIRRVGPKRYTRHDSHLISLIADQVGIAIENASLFEAQIEHLKELQSLNDTLNKEKLKIETILTSMADGVVVTDIDGKIVLVNRAGCRILEKNEEKLYGNSIDKIFPGQCYFKDIKDAVVNKGIRYKKEISLLSKNNEQFNLLVLATGMKIALERWEGFVLVIQNITELKRIDKMKTEFVSMVSHELRTPLTSIQGFTELMITRDFAKDRRDRYLNIIQKDSARLMRLINNVLDISKLESGQIIFHPESVKLNEFIPEILSSFEAQTEKHNIIFKYSGEIPVILIDKDMFNNVVTNIVSNAIKYSPKGGDVRVALRKDTNFLILSIQDEGAGIDEDKLDKIFDKFYRVDSSLTRETWGTGLGLATVKYIVEAFGGKIWVESEVGKGSDFIITLPLED